jgi:hypothetical protein
VRSKGLSMKLTKKDVAVVALAKLGDGTRVVDTEDAAIAAHEIDPKAFGWKKYNERVDLDVVRTTLRHEGESKSPRIEGSIQNGWHLTPLGTAWIADNAAIVLDRESITVASTPAAAQRWRAETREVGAAINRIRKSTAFRLWTEGKNFTPRQAADVFRIDEYTPIKDRSHKAARLQELARGDAQIDLFMTEAIPAALVLSAPTGRQKQEGKS